MVSKTRRGPAETYDTSVVPLSPGDTLICTVQSKARLGQDYCGIVPWRDKFAHREREPNSERGRSEVLGWCCFSGWQLALLGKQCVPRDVTSETLLKALRDLGWAVGVQRCSARRVGY